MIEGTQATLQTNNYYFLFSINCTSNATTSWKLLKCPEMTTIITIDKCSFIDTNYSEIYFKEASTSVKLLSPGPTIETFFMGLPNLLNQSTLKYMSIQYEKSDAPGSLNELSQQNFDLDNTFRTKYIFIDPTNKTLNNVGFKCNWTLGDCSYIDKIQLLSNNLSIANGFLCYNKSVVSIISYNPNISIDDALFDAFDQQIFFLVNIGSSSGRNRVAIVALYVNDTNNTIEIRDDGQILLNEEKNTFQSFCKRFLLYNHNYFYLFCLSNNLFTSHPNMPDKIEIFYQVYYNSTKNRSDQYIVSTGGDMYSMNYFQVASDLSPSNTEYYSISSDYTFSLGEFQTQNLKKIFELNNKITINALSVFSNGLILGGCFWDLTQSKFISILYSFDLYFQFSSQKNQTFNPSSESCFHSFLKINDSNVVGTLGSTLNSTST